MRMCRHVVGENGHRVHKSWITMMHWIHHAMLVLESKVCSLIHRLIHGSGQMLTTEHGGRSMRTALVATTLRGVCRGLLELVASPEIRSFL